MKKRTVIKCIKDVIMQDGEKTFTKDYCYTAYPYLMEEGWDVKKVICAKNDQGSRYIIKDDSDSFFNKYFEVIEIN